MGNVFDMDGAPYRQAPLTRQVARKNRRYFKLAAKKFAYAKTVVIVVEYFDGTLNIMPSTDLPKAEAAWLMRTVVRDIEKQGS